MPTESLLEKTALEPSMDESTYHRNNEPSLQDSASSTRRRVQSAESGYVTTTLVRIPRNPHPPHRSGAPRPGASSPQSPATSSAKIKWEKMGLSQPGSEGNQTSAVIRSANATSNQ